MFIYMLLLFLPSTSGILVYVDIISCSTPLHITHTGKLPFGVVCTEAHTPDVVSHLGFMIDTAA